MKKILCLLMALMMLGLFMGCGKANAQAGAKVGSGIEDQLNDPVNRGENTVSATGIPSMDPADMLTPEAASEVALNHAQVSEEDAVGLHAQLEIDDGIPQYEVDFHVGHVEYEYHIHAETGEVLSFDRDA